MKAVVHCNPAIAWQQRRGAFFAEGFRNAGIECDITSDRFRHDGFPVLLGTTLWRDIERSGDYLLVDRCSFGDTDRFVSLVWSGHGSRGDHRYPGQIDGSRWERHGVDLVPWREDHSRVVLCGQTEAYSPRYAQIEDWYASVKATHFRPHPAGSNPTGLPRAVDFTDAAAVTLNSSIAVQCVLNGIPTVTMDEGSMAWDVTAHRLEDLQTFDRTAWCHRLAWTQWTDDEIREGSLWRCRW